jgi:hypothetical protein
VLIYATPDDLAGYTGQPAPDNAEHLLRAASRRVARATRGAVYATQPNGKPVDDDLVDALREATCAQVATWAALDVDLDKGAAGAAKVKTASSVDGASVTYQVAAGQADALAAATTALADEAADILAAAGLLSTSAVSYG